MTPLTQRTYLVTGVTGFLGKVILHELIRRRDEFAVGGIVVVARARGKKSGADRFREDVIGSPCFNALPGGWAEGIQVLDADLSDPGLGQSPEHRALLANVTHVIHSAASVGFTLPAQVAAKANITSSLNLLEAVRPCPRLERFVYVSTAYVTPHHRGPIVEELVQLKTPASEMLALIEEAKLTDPELLAKTGHPNTYTMTKSISECLLAERRGSIPLSIVRPSIITASRAHPVPGWIDSNTGFGAFVTLIGMGHLRAVVGHADVRLDLIAVDDVTDRVLDATKIDVPHVTVQHAVAGADRSATVHNAWAEIERHFRIQPIGRRPARGYLGPAGLRYILADLIHHRLPMAIAGITSGVKRRQVRKLASRLAYLNDVFPYFTSNTFTFETSVPLDDRFDADQLVSTVCRGVSRHVFKQDDREWVLAGREVNRDVGDTRWALTQPRANLFVRFGCWAAVKVLARVSDRVTVDIPSFERAHEAVPAGAAIALLPSHRSFFDFILCSVLAFARPDLGIRVPHIAAAAEFGRLPFLGRLLRYVHTFFVERGASRDNRDLSRRVKDLVDRGQVIEFFVEGQRSRARTFLPAKRGLLRCLQESGHTVALYPIAISYDRLPEEGVFARELASLPKAPLRIGPFYKWLGDVWRGRVQLGRMHVVCAEPVILDGSSDLRVAGETVIERLRGAMPITTYQLEAYLSRHPMPGVDATTLRALIEQKGVRVLKSGLPVPTDIDANIAKTYREHFGHLLADGDIGPPAARELAG